MLKYLRTSITDSNAQTVVNTVNTVGVMGKGLALHFKKQSPEMFKLYKKYCDEGKLEIGKLFLWKNNDQWILNFPTKKHWRNPSKLEYIESGLKKFVENYSSRGIREISFPRLGCGNGGLDWDDVKPLMERYLFKLPINIYIHDYTHPIGTPEHNTIITSDFSLSFDKVITDLTEVMERKKLKTLTTHSSFFAKIEDENIVFTTNSSKSKKRVDIDELKEVWALLLNGPVTHKQLIGKSKNSYSYLFGLLAGLPYIRPVRVQDPIDNSDSIAIKLSKIPTSVFDDFHASSNCQRTFKWA